MGDQFNNRNQLSFPREFNNQFNFPRQFNNRNQFNNQFNNQQQFNRQFNQFDGQNQVSFRQFDRDQFSGNNFNQANDFYFNRYGYQQQQPLISSTKDSTTVSTTTIT